MKAVLCAAIWPQAGKELDVADIVRGIGLADLLGPVVEDVQGRRARGEMDIGAGEIVGLLAHHVKKLERVRNRRQSAVQHRAGKPGVAFSQVHPGAEVAQELKDARVLHLGPQVTQDIPGFADDPFEQVRAQEFELRSQGHGFASFLIR